MVTYPFASPNAIFSLLLSTIELVTELPYAVFISYPSLFISRVLQSNIWIKPLLSPNQTSFLLSITDKLVKSPLDTPKLFNLSIFKIDWEISSAFKISILLSS